MKPAQTSAIWALAALFAGCATAAPAPLADLKAPSEAAKPVTLPSKACTKIAAAFGREAEVCVMAGTYQLEKENSQGQLFLGDLPSVYWKLGDDFVLVYGGVWLPRDSGVAPRIYFYQTAGLTKGKSVEELEAVRLAAAPKAAPDSSQVTSTLATQSTPTNATPAQVGLGAGIAAGIVAALTGGEPLPSLYGEPKSVSFVESIRQHFAAGRGAP